MKKLLITLFAVFAMVLSGCGDANLNLYNAGIEVTKAIETLIKDQVYVDYCLGDDFKEEVDLFVASDYDTPIKVYSISKHDPDKLMEFLGVNFDNASEEAKQQIYYKASDFESSVLNLIFSYTVEHYDFDVYIVSNYFRCIKMYDGYKLNEELSYLYIFETGKPILVHFSEINGSVQALGGFCLLDTTLSALRDFFEPLGSSVSIVS